MSQQMWKTAAEELLEEGELRAYRAMLRSSLQKKFQKIPEDLLQRIAAADLDRLKAACLQVLDLQSLDELQL